MIVTVKSRLKGASGENLILGLPLPRLLALFSDGHNGYKHWFAYFVAKTQRSIICGLLLIESRKGFEFFILVVSCTAWNEFSVALLIGQK